MNVFKLRAVLGTALFLSVLLLSGCSKETAQIDADDRVLATVNGVDISVTWFEQTYINFLIQTGGDDNEVNRVIHLDNLIDSILLAEAFEVSDLADDAGYDAFLQRQKQSILAERYFDEAFLFTLEAPTDDELRRAFALSKDQVIVRHLFFLNQEDASASFERLESGVGFLEEAQTVFETASFDSSAGYLGPVKYYSVDDAFAEAAFNLEVDEFSAPVRSRFGYHIIRVENRIIEPLLTESNYQTSRRGLSSQYRLRKRRLEGDRFVRSFMEERSIQVNPVAIGALQSLLRDFSNEVNPRPEIVASREQNFEIDSLRYHMNPSTELATYEWDGERYSFTAGDYVFWLEDLPFQEALGRTAASVGRAMRNQLLARAGDEEGYDDATAAALLERDALQERSTLMRRYFRENPVQDIDEALMRKAYDTAGLSKQLQYKVDLEWAIFNTRAEAERVSQLVSLEPDRFRNFEAYQSQTDVPLFDLPDLAQHVRGAPIGESVVVGLRESWAVLKVLRRVRQDLDWEEHREAIVRQLAPFAGEYQLVSEKRASAEIDVDQVLFDLIKTF